MNGIIDHTMVRVADLDASIAWYSDHLNYEEKGRWEAETFTVVYLAPGDAHEETACVELTYNHDGGTYNQGDAWGHLAVRVSDVEAAYEQLMDEGVSDYRDPESCGGSYAFVRDPDGYEIELVERDSGIEWSLDHTMIRVEDITDSIGWFVRTLDYQHVDRMEGESFENHYLRPRNGSEEAMAVELTYNHDVRTYDEKNSWGHLAVRTDALEEYWEQLVARGAEDYRDPESCDNNYAFTRGPEGHEIEVLNPRDSPVDRVHPEQM